MTQSTLILAAFFASACGGEEPAPEPAPAPAPKAAAPELKAWTEALSSDDMLKYGKRVFMSKGSNTCNDCHGPDGTKGRLEQSANLTDPSSWKSTKALGGDVAKVDAALFYLVSSGSKKFNQSYAADHPEAGWDWSKTDAKAYDIQMFGVTQSSTMSELKKIRKELKKAGIEITKADLATFGATAVLSHVRSLATAPAAE
jgi:mono/diheme cytochrome c family protein